MTYAVVVIYAVALGGLIKEDACMKTIAVLTNGGDTCALNASLRSIRDNAYHAGYKKIYGVKRGYQGLLDGWIVDITHKEIDPRIGGSCLGSLRTSPTKLVERESSYEIDRTRCRKMAECLSDYRIDVLVVIGGDGTLQATTMFQEWCDQERASQRFRPFEFIGFLKTIDNDIRTYTVFKGIEVSLCPGFPSAVKKIASCAEDLRVTARTAERAFSIETMGRDAGWLAAAATFGGAEILLVPEHLKLWYELTGDEDLAGKKPTSLEVTNKVMGALVDEITDFYVKNRNVLIAVAEGFEPAVEVEEVESFARIIGNLYGPRKKVGATELVTMLVAPVLEYYFWCLSRICTLRYDEIELAALIEQVIDEGRKQPVGQKYHKAMKSSEHPLRKWNVKNKLRTTLGLAEEGTDVVSEEDNSRSTQKRGSETKEGFERTPLILPPYEFEIRPHRTDYLPRSGPPSSYDYRLATVLGQKVGRMLLDEIREFGAVPALKEVVPYRQLSLDVIRTISIDEIRTQNFGSIDYFDQRSPLQVSERITNLFRTIMTGPTDLEQAIGETETLS